MATEEMEESSPLSNPKALLISAWKSLKWHFRAAIWGDQISRLRIVI